MKQKISVCCQNEELLLRIVISLLLLQSEPKIFMNGIKSFVYSCDKIRRFHLTFPKEELDVKQAPKQLQAYAPKVLVLLILKLLFTCD